MLENRMVIESEWKMLDLPEALENRADILGPVDAWKNTDGPGYREIGTGVFVPEGYAFDYAIGHCVEMAPNWFHRVKRTEEFKKMVVEWFYSDNWIEED